MKLLYVIIFKDMNKDTIIKETIYIPCQYEYLLKLYTEEDNDLYIASNNDGFVNHIRFKLMYSICDREFAIKNGCSKNHKNIYLILENIFDKADFNFKDALQMANEYIKNENTNISKYLVFLEDICIDNDDNKIIFKKDMSYEILYENEDVFLVKMPIDNFDQKLRFGIEKKLEGIKYRIQIERV